MQRREKEKKKLKYDPVDGLIPEIRKVCGFPHHVAPSSPKGAGKKQQQQQRKKEVMEEEWVMPEAQNCSVCSTGGEILCCETCPASFHLECLGLHQTDIPEEDIFYCDRCKKMPPGVQLFPPEKCCKSNSPLIRIENENRRNFETIEWHYDRLRAEAGIVEKGPPPGVSEDLTEEELFARNFADPLLLQALSTGNIMEYSLPEDYALEKELFAHDQFEDNRKRPIVTGRRCFKCKLRDEWSPQIICDFCKKPWHQKCVTPPLINLPGSTYWMCPNHVESLLETVNVGEQIKREDQKAQAKQYKKIEKSLSSYAIFHKFCEATRDIRRDKMVETPILPIVSNEISRKIDKNPCAVMLRLKGPGKGRKGRKKEETRLLFSFYENKMVPSPSTPPKNAPTTSKSSKKSSPSTSSEGDKNYERLDKKRSIKLSDEELIMSIMPFEKAQREEYLSMRMGGFDQEMAASFITRQAAMVERCKIFYSNWSEKELTKLMRRDLDPHETVRNSGVQSMPNYQEKGGVRKKIKADVENLIQHIGFGNSHSNRSFSSFQTEAFFRRQAPPPSASEVVKPATLRQICMNSEREAQEFQKVYSYHPEPGNLEFLTILAYEHHFDSSEERDDFWTSSMCFWSKEPFLKMMEKYREEHIKEEEEEFKKEELDEEEVAQVVKEKADSEIIEKEPSEAPAEPQTQPEEVASLLKKGLKISEPSVDTRARSDKSQEVDEEKNKDDEAPNEQSEEDKEKEVEEKADNQETVDEVKKEKSEEPVEKEMENPEVHPEEVPEASEGQKNVEEPLEIHEEEKQPSVSEDSEENPEGQNVGEGGEKSKSPTPLDFPEAETQSIQEPHHQELNELQHGPAHEPEPDFGPEHEPEPEPVFGPEHDHQYGPEHWPEPEPERVHEPVHEQFEHEELYRQRIMSNSPEEIANIEEEEAIEIPQIYCGNSFDVVPDSISDITEKLANVDFVGVIRPEFYEKAESVNEFEGISLDLREMTLDPRMTKSVSDLADDLIDWGCARKNIRHYVLMQNAPEPLREHTYCSCGGESEGSDDDVFPEEFEDKEHSISPEVFGFAQEIPMELSRTPLQSPPRPSAAPVAKPAEPKFATPALPTRAPPRRTIMISPTEGAPVVKKRGRPVGSKNRKEGEEKPKRRSSGASISPRGGGAGRGGRGGGRGGPAAVGGRGRGRGSRRSSAISTTPRESVDSLNDESSSRVESETPRTSEEPTTSSDDVVSPDPPITAKLKNQVEELKKKYTKMVLERKLEETKDSYFRARDHALIKFSLAQWREHNKQCTERRMNSLIPYETRFFVPNQRVVAKLEVQGGESYLPIAIQRGFTKIGTARDCHIRVDRYTDELCLSMAEYHCDIIWEYHSDRFYLSTVGVESVFVNGNLVKRPCLTPMEEAIRFRNRAKAPEFEDEKQKEHYTNSNEALKRVKCRCEMEKNRENHGISVKSGIVRLENEAEIRIGCVLLKFHQFSN